MAPSSSETTWVASRTQREACAVPSSTLAVRRVQGAILIDVDGLGPAGLGEWGWLTGGALCTLWCSMDPMRTHHSWSCSARLQRTSLHEDPSPRHAAAVFELELNSLSSQPTPAATPARATWHACWPARCQPVCADHDVHHAMRTTLLAA